MELSYAYNRQGALAISTTPLSRKVIAYHPSGLPKIRELAWQGSSEREELSWSSSAKLLSYKSLSSSKSYTYSESGLLEEERGARYHHDGTGLLTKAPSYLVTALDPFSRVVEERQDTKTLTTTYDAMGQVTTREGKRFTWDPWGRLLRIQDESSLFEASYDALGRRLEVRYAKAGDHPMVTRSFYDPEEEFRGIGVQSGGHLFWKLYGPTGCEAVIDERGAFAILEHDALGHLSRVVTRERSYKAPILPSYALSLAWHKKTLLTS